MPGPKDTGEGGLAAGVGQDSPCGAQVLQTVTGPRVVPVGLERGRHHRVCGPVGPGPSSRDGKSHSTFWKQEPAALAAVRLRVRRDRTEVGTEPGRGGSRADPGAQC